MTSQGSDLWKDKDRFTKFAHASLELCKVYQELARHNSSRRELSAAEMHLKNTIKQVVLLVSKIGMCLQVYLVITITSKATHFL